MNNYKAYNIHFDFKVQRFNFEEHFYHNEYNFAIILDEQDEKTAQQLLYKMYTRAYKSFLLLF